MPPVMTAVGQAGTNRPIQQDVSFALGNGNPFALVRRRPGACQTTPHISSHINNSRDPNGMPSRWRAVQRVCTSVAAALKDLNHKAVAWPVLAHTLWSYNARLICGRLNQLR
jgi:hypothetical protein